MNVIYALVGAAPQFFCDALGRVPSCEAGVRRAFVVGFCGCALLALWTANRHRNRSSPSRKPDSGARHALGAVQDGADDPIAHQTAHGDGTSAPADRVQCHWTESMSDDGESSADTKESDGDDGDGKGMRDCRRSPKAHKDQSPVAREADAMCKAHIDGEIGALLLDDDNDDEGGEGDDGNEGDAVDRCHGRETTATARQPPPNSGTEILENGDDDRGGDDHVVAASSGGPALCERDVAGRPDDAIAHEMSHDGDALAVTDGILARWSAQGLSVHASWAPAYADAHP